MNVNEFDLFGPLPTGTTVLEASAGTGKTFTIAALVARYVAEGVARLDELLVVTFGRAATQELRDRVRERLVCARDDLADPATARTSTDDLVRHLASGSDAEVDARRQRLVTALASFDAATVATTHQFCQQMLVGLGTAGDVDAGAVLVENLDDLVTEVVQDLYLRKWGHGELVAPTMSLTQAQKLAATVVGDPQAVLVPEEVDDDDSPAATRLRFARTVRSEIDRRKRQRRILGFDDLLTRLRDTLADSNTGPSAAARLRSRYRIVLVDEFQDTDPVQWDVLRLAFHDAATLVLIGDPKQAIYAFRGADVQAYLAAAELAGQRATLARNWRSDPQLLRGLDALFRGAALGDPRIVVAPVSAAHDGRSLDDDQPPVRIRLIPKGSRTRLPVAAARELVIADVVREIVTQLDRAPLLRLRDGSPQRRVRPGDIAVIVRTGTQLDMVHEALLAAGVPSVQRTTSSVFGTAAAGDWVVLLEALEQPHRSGRLRRLAVSPFVGWDAAALETDDVDRLGLRLRAWGRVHAERGVAALFETISRDQRLASRLLGQIDGERLLTDLRHVGEAVHAASMAGRLGLTAALEWLRRRVDEAGEDASVERSRRLDSDAAAVQVVTVHSSKGLEFPIVHVPFGWDRYVHDEDIPLFHEDGTARRVRNVGGSGSPGFDADLRRHRSEEFGEDLRLLYVALTRAQCQVTSWWAPSDKNTPCSPLHRLLFTGTPAAGIAERVGVPADAKALERSAALAVDGCLSVCVAPPAPAVSWQRQAEPAAGLAAAVLGRGVDTWWRRTSYSALTAAAHEAAPVIGSEPEVDEKDDEPPVAAPAGPGAELTEVPSPMAELPGGAAFGTLVHAVLELLDPAGGRLEVELPAQVRAQLARFGPADLDPDTVATGLLPALRTPLGELAGGRSLADIPAADRLAELEFELPLRGGDRPNGTSRLRELAPLLRAHLPVDDPLAPYAELLDAPVLGDAPLKGYLTGSIDAVLRVGGSYVVVDYKTNRLGEPDLPLTAWDYRRPAMAEAMLQAHYPLQALLYEVALHRFLRWRLADYAPERDLGGVLYLFLRGMCGPGVRFADGTVPGVFAWRPPAALVVAASDLLAAGAP
ncbi:MAG TPA: UvrD-helicase domain-containing protein [Jatrophihabitans sp.]|nr:UvrD-helicase domain-containing protein [Jatrophihabitans sp.]